MKVLIVVIAVAALTWTARALLPDRDPPPAQASRVPDPSTALPSSTRPTFPQLPSMARVAVEARIDEAPVIGALAKAAPAPTSAQFRDRIDEAFRAEAIDTAWSQSAVRTLGAKLPALLPARSAVRSVDCRGSLCRIETSHVGVDDYRDFVQRAFLGQPELWNAGFFTNVLVDPVPGQPVITVAYLAREGQSLPSPEVLFSTQ